MNKLFRSISIGLLVLLSFTAIQAATVNIQDFGAVANDGEDDSEGIQQAMLELVANGGGTMVFPSGIFELKKEISFSPETMMNLKLVGDKGTVIKLTGGDSSNYFVIERAIQFEVENLNFVANNEELINAERVIWVKEAVHSRIKGSSFFGIGAKESIVLFENTNASVEETVFCGSGSQTSIVHINNSKGLKVIKTEFRGTGSFLGDFYDKGQVVAPVQWLSVLNSVSGEDAMGQGTVSVKDSYFGTGPLYGVTIENQKSAEIFGSTFVVTDTTGASGVKFNNVSYADINGASFFGIFSQRSALMLSGPTYVDVNALSLSNINLVVKDGRSTVNIKHCPVCNSGSMLRKK